MTNPNLFLGKNDTMSFQLNTRIAIRDGINGVVRYVGPVKEKEGEWVGIELDSPIGSNDGSYRGVHYFACSPRYGVFIRTTRLIGEIGLQTDSAGGVNFVRPEQGRCSPGPADGRKDSVRPPHDTFDPNQSLFMDSTSRHPSETPADSREDRSLASLRHENVLLREESRRQKEAFDTMMDLSARSVKKVRAELGDLQIRLEKIAGYPVESSEKERVAALVYEIYVEDRNGNPEKVCVLYNRFKGIMGKYNIKID